MKKQHKPDVGSMLSSVGKVWSERLSLESIEMCYRFAVSKIQKIQSFWRLLQVAYSCLDMFRLHAFRLLFGSAVFFWSRWHATKLAQTWLVCGSVHICSLASIDLLLVVTGKYALNSKQEWGTKKTKKSATHLVSCLWGNVRIAKTKQLIGQCPMEPGSKPMLAWSKMCFRNYRDCSWPQSSQVGQVPKFCLPWKEQEF